MDSSSTNAQEYYQDVGHEYEIDPEEFKLICNAPFKFVREVFTKGVLKDIRLQYLGTFEVSDSRIRYSRSKLEENYSKGVISEKRFNDRTKVLDSYERKD